MRAYQIQESTKEIMKNVILLSNHIKAFEEYHKKMGGHLATTVSAYNLSSKEFGKIDKDFTRITGNSIEVDVLSIDKPSEE
jgi:DNA anti-recombination protein RmuC